MNKRLHEIYRACRSAEALASQEQFGSTNVLLGSEVERFAEMILAEAMQVVRDRWYELNDLPDIENSDDPYVKREIGIRVGSKSENVILLERLKQHFGIKYETNQN